MGVSSRWCAWSSTKASARSVLRRCSRLRVSPLGPSGLRVLRIPDAPPSTGAPPEVVATIGSFDGVHLGHRALLDVVTRRAAERSVTTAVITFDPHPRRGLRPDAPLKLISPLDERLSLLDSVGVELALGWRFDERLRSLPPD